MIRTDTARGRYEGAVEALSWVGYTVSITDGRHEVRHANTKAD